MELKLYKASFSAPDGFFDSKIIYAESLERAEEIAEEHRRDCEWPHADVVELGEVKVEEDLDEYLCLECGRTFKAKSNQLPLECDYCNSILTEEIIS